PTFQSPLHRRRRCNSDAIREVLVEDKSFSLLFIGDAAATTQILHGAGNRNRASVSSSSETPLQQESEPQSIQQQFEEFQSPLHRRRRCNLDRLQAERQQPVRVSVSSSSETPLQPQLYTQQTPIPSHTN